MMNQLGREAQGWGYVSLSPGCPQIHSWLFPGPALSSTLPPCLPSSCVRQWEALAGWSKRVGEAVYFDISFPLLQGMCLAMNGSYSHSGIPAFCPFGSSLSSWNSFLFYTFFWLQGMRDSLLTRNWTCVPCNGSVLSTGLPGKSLLPLFQTRLPCWLRW